MTHLNRCWIGVLLFAAVVLAVSSAAAVTDEERAGARAQAIAGAEAFEAGRWQEAVDRFQRAESVVHSPVHLVYIARAEIELGKLVQAQERLLKVVQERVAPDDPEAIVQAHKDADALLTQLEPRIPQLTLQVEGAGDKPVSVQMDGKDVPAAFIGVARPVNPGEHSIQATGEGLSGQTTVALTEGEQKTAVVQLTPDPNAVAPAPTGAQPAATAEISATGQDQGVPGGGMDPRIMRIASYAAFGVGAVGFGIGIPFALKYKDRKDNADSLFKQCNPGCTADQRATIKGVDDDANKAGTAATIGLITGGVGVAAGATLLVLSILKDDSGAEEQAKRRTEPHVTGFVGPNQVGLAGTF